MLFSWSLLRTSGSNYFLSSIWVVAEAKQDWLILKTLSLFDISSFFFI